jgi:hypothetical protein
LPGPQSQVMKHIAREYKEEESIAKKA